MEKEFVGRLMTPEEQAEAAKVQAVTMDKLSMIFDGLDENSVRSIVAVKTGDKPLIHMLAIPNTLADKFELVFKLLEIKHSYVEVINADFADMGVLAPKES